MAALPLALAYRRLQEESAALRLVRADHTPIIAALLTSHLGAPGARVPSDELHERLDADLEILRDHFDLSDRSARGYCDDWRAAGFLVRRTAEGARGETYELSPDAIVAIRFIEQLKSPRSTVTGSRLLALAQAVRQLAVDTNPDASRRLESLHEERRRIDAEIQRIRGGAVDVLDHRVALERVTDLLLLAQDLPADFAGVRARFEELNHDLRLSILAADDTQTTVLADVFRGVDLIQSSDEGQTFSGFSALLRDAERSSAFEADLAAVLDRDFSDLLPAASRRTLRSLVRDLKRGSREVHGVLTEFARGLRRYVFSQEFQRDRALRDALQQGLAAAAAVGSTIKPYAALEHSLELSAVPMSSIGTLALHDPSDVDTGDSLPDADAATLDLATIAAIARESEIDFAELIENVNTTLAEQGHATVGEVLARHPATQGLASVVGLLSLAAAHGTVDHRTEHLAWTGQDDVDRRAEVDAHTFTEKIR